jgi:hypothetical protein
MRTRTNTKPLNETEQYIVDALSQRMKLTAKPVPRPTPTKDELLATFEREAAAYTESRIARPPLFIASVGLPPRSALTPAEQYAKDNFDRFPEAYRQYEWLVEESRKSGIKYGPLTNAFVNELKAHRSTTNKEWGNHHETQEHNTDQ